MLIPYSPLVFIGLRYRLNIAQAIAFLVAALTITIKPSMIYYDAFVVHPVEFSGFAAVIVPVMQGLALVIFLPIIYLLRFTKRKRDSASRRVFF
jgi:hypothetical protein